MVNSVKEFLKTHGKGLFDDLIGIVGLGLIWLGASSFSTDVANILIGVLLIAYAIKSGD